jgi:hypothetical protein
MNVRWDAVVTNSYSFSPPGRGADARAAPEAAQAGGSLEIRVRLFGMLLRPGTANPMVLQFDGRCALRDVIEELGRRLGSDVLRTLVGEDGELINTCRLFVNGEPVQDTAAPISRGSKAATVEVILIREIEGG